MPFTPCSVLPSTPLTLPSHTHRVRRTDWAPTDAAAGPLRSSKDVGVVVAVNRETRFIRVRREDDPGGAGWWYPPPTVRGTDLNVMIVAVDLASEDVIAALLTAAPAAVELEAADGCMPIDRACANGASDGVMAVLLAAAPYTVSQGARTATGEPLLVTAAQACGAGAIRVVAAADSAALSAMANGRLPLHWAVDGSVERPLRSAEAVAALLELYPESVSAVSEAGETPLQVAVKTLAPPAVVRVLLDADPALAAACDRATQELPLHLLCKWDGDELNGNPPARVSAWLLETLQLLLDANPEAPLALDYKGHTPLHTFMCSNGGITGLMAPLGLALLRAGPGAAAVASNDGGVPLAFLGEGQRGKTGSTEFLTALLEAHPQAATKEVRGYSTPLLHTALVLDLPWPFFRAALAANPSAAAVPYSSGLLPLHSALLRRAPLPVIAELLAAHPEAASTPLCGEDGKQATYPLHLAVAAAPVEVVAALVAAHPEGVALKDERGCVRTRLHLDWTGLRLCSSDEFPVALHSS